LSSRANSIVMAQGVGREYRGGGVGQVVEGVDDETDPMNGAFCGFFAV